MTPGRQLAVVAAGALATAAGQIAINPNVFVNPSTNLLIDPWVYTGFFLDLPAQAARFSGTYYGSRLSFLLPGFVAHRLSPPLGANYLLHLGLYVVLLTATYSLMRRGTDTSTALLTTILMAWNPVIVAAVSWDYVDGYGIVLLVVALALLDASAREHRWSTIRAFAAGVTAGCLVTANIFLIVLLPILGLFVFVRADDGWRTIARLTGPALGGAIVTFAAYASISVALGGSWLYLGPQWREGTTLVAARNPWQLSGYGWVVYATWLVLPLIATAGAVLALARWLRARRPVTFDLTMQCVLLAMAGTWLVIQTWNTPVLQISYYSSYLAPASVIALALQAAPARGRVSIAVLATTTYAICAAFAWIVLTDVPRAWALVPMSLIASLAAAPAIGPDHAPAAGATIIGALGGSAALVWLRLYRANSTVRWIGFVVMLMASSIAVPQFWPTNNHATGPARYEVTALAHRYIAEQSVGHPLRVWYSWSLDSPYPFRGISSTFLWGYVLVNEQMPALSKEQAATLTAGTRLAVLAPAGADVDALRSALQPFGLDYRAVARREFGHGPAAFVVVIADVLTV